MFCVILRVLKFVKINSTDLLIFRVHRDKKGGEFMVVSHGILGTA